MTTTMLAPAAVPVFRPPGRLLLRLGYEIIFDVPTPTPMLLMLYAHPSVSHRLVGPETIHVEPHVPVTDYLDDFGNRVGRIIAPPGQVRIYSESVIQDSGEPDATKAEAQQHRVEELPPDVLPYLLGSRYCEVDRLSAVAWDLFGKTPPGWARVQAVSDWVHRHIEFGYRHARANKTALDVYVERPSCIESISTFALRSRARSSRVASMPERRGIQMSISTTSGFRRMEASTASRPSPTSATTSTVFSASSKRRRAWRKSWWSSASTTRTTGSLTP